MPFGIEMKQARDIAFHYGLKSSEAEVFKLCWKLRRRADEFSKRWADTLDAEVLSAYSRMADWTRGTPSYAKGHSIVRHRSTPGERYVIFSDHHWTWDGHRQDFFGASGNRDLYVDVLGEYATEDYTLVENGDVEELIIFEPTLGQMQQRVADNHNALEGRRFTHRKQLLDKILGDTKLRPLYDALADFQARGRLVRVAGNHDLDLQEPTYHEALKQRIPGVLKPCDYLFLETASGGGALPKVDYVIAHGHQFDKATTPRYAAWVGETISETMSWAYQGADRTWRWNDDVRSWALGLTPFRGDLVDDDYNPKMGNIIDIAGALFGNLHNQAAWEALFKHNIAWEYFEHDDPQEAIDKEVKTGDEFFKFRHLDELVLKQQMLSLFTAAERPVLVLGHTHEARIFQAPTPGVQGVKACPWYLNSGAAGRFENLLWALEIDDGVPRLVSWSRAQPRVGPAERRTWTHLSLPDGHRLVASTAPVPL
ncbi:MAG: hypothetical protein P1V51_23825 [Deltaproteobacteria bacterium]|nr:hypothetical protein [Deltaproteobacteria bacterium]